MSLDIWTGSSVLQNIQASRISKKIPIRVLPHLTLALHTGDTGISHTNQIHSLQSLHFGGREGRIEGALQRV